MKGEKSLSNSLQGDLQTQTHLRRGLKVFKLCTGILDDSLLSGCFLQLLQLPLVGEEAFVNALTYTGEGWCGPMAVSESGSSHFKSRLGSELIAWPYTSHLLSASPPHSIQWVYGYCFADLPYCIAVRIWGNEVHENVLNIQNATKFL